MTCIIAEAGVNHNGSLDMAIQLIKKASEAKVDVVKFQTGKPERVISQHAPKAEYQTRTTQKEESQLNMIKKLELSNANHYTLKKICKENNLEFLSSPFDLESVTFLSEELDVSRIKIASGEITNAPLILKAAETKKPIILSTGMCTMADIELALGIIAFGYLKSDQSPSRENFHEAFISEEGQIILKENVTLLHCTTEYPSPYSSINLNAMDTLKVAFGLEVGLSDHSPGIFVPLAAVAKGGVVIEKHFTLDRTLPGPDHKASLEPNELSEMVKGIRAIESTLGTTQKLPDQAELKNRNIARKSLIASVAIKKGEIFTKENLTCKRPGTGVPPIHYWDYLGRKANKNYNPDELIKQIYIS